VTFGGLELRAEGGTDLEADCHNNPLSSAESSYEGVDIRVGRELRDVSKTKHDVFMGFLI